MKLPSILKAFQNKLYLLPESRASLIQWNYSTTFRNFTVSEFENTESSLDPGSFPRELNHQRKNNSLPVSGLNLD